MANEHSTNVVLRNEKGQLLPGQKLGIGNRGGNGGTPRVDIRKLAKKHGKRAIEVAIEVMERDMQGSARLSAAKYVLAIGWGIQQDGTEREQSAWTPEQRMRVLELVGAVREAIAARLGDVEATAMLEGISQRFRLAAEIAQDAEALNGN